MSIEEGIYVIIAAQSENGLAIGPIPLIYPPPTVRVRVLSGYALDKWRLVSQDDGFAITDLNPRGGYTIIRKDDTAYVAWSSEGFPKAWSIEPAGDNTFVIKEPTEDRLFTRVDSDGYGSVVALQPADGSVAQKWTFTRIDRD